MKIVVLAGGISTERDVSLVTGTKVCNALINNKHKAILCDVFMGYDMSHETVEEEFEHAHLIEEMKVDEVSPDIETIKNSREKSEDGFFGKNILKLCKGADIVFMALHGEDGENGKIQATFDLLGIKYTGTGYLGSALAMNKDMSKDFFAKYGIPFPEGISVTVENYKTVKPKRYPCIVKPTCGGSSVGVSIANNDEEYDEALKEAFRWEKELVVEDYVKGREFSIGVIEGKALPIIEIAPICGFYDYKNKYQAGSSIETCPADLSPELTLKMQKYAESAYESLKLDTYARMDFIMNDKEEMFCLEANTLPGMTPTSLLPQEARALGISFDELCQQLVDVSMKKYE